MGRSYAHTAESKLKMSRSRLGVPFTEVHKQNLSKSLAGRKVRQTKLVCKNCKQEMFGIRSKKFCSKKCMKGFYGTTKLRSKEYSIYKPECGICGSTEQLVGDHCHKTNKPRGILCRNCNLAIGNFRDRVDLLHKAIVYLEEK